MQLRAPARLYHGRTNQDERRAPVIRPGGYFADLREHDAAAEAYAALWHGYVETRGRAPSSDEALAARLPHIGQVRWRLVLIAQYCKSAGMLEK